MSVLVMSHLQLWLNKRDCRHNRHLRRCSYPLSSPVCSQGLEIYYGVRWCLFLSFLLPFDLILFYGINVQLHSLNFLKGQLPCGSDYPVIDMIVLHSFLATALRGFNDLGHSVTPTFLFRKRFYLQ